MAEIRSLKPDSKVQSIVGDQSAPHLFSFLEIDWSTTNYEELRYHLERHYNVPSTEHWGFAARKFRMLQMYFEIGTNTAHEAWGEEEMSNVAAHENSPELAKKSDMTVESEIPKQTPALPRVKLFKACTFLMRVATTNEPLICKAFGTIAPTLYEEIFWEKLAVLEREQDVSINVLSITHLTAQDVVFFIEFGGHEFKIRYLQWGTLIQSYPDVTEAPESFIHGKGVPETAYAFVKGLQLSAEKCRQLNKSTRFAYHYIRAWAINRGFYRRKQVDNCSINPNYIVDCLTSQAHKPFLKDSHSKLVSTSIFRFFEHFDSDYSNNGSPPLGDRPYAEDEAEDWLGLLKNLEQQSVSRRMGCMLYTRIHVLFSGSDIQGGQWFRDIVDPRIQKLKEDYSRTMGKDNVHLWHYRLTSVDLYSTAMSTTSDDTYEGYYIIGFKAVGTWRRPLVDDITLKWQAQMHTKIMEKQSDGCHRSVTTRVMTEQEMDDIVLRKCPRTWPYNAVEPPDNSGQEADTSVSHSARKAQAVLQNKNHDESASLRPAEDVINRLKYDRANFKVDEWAIGYVDRHMQAMQEKPVRDWATDVTDEAFIPQHRIEYFKVYPKDSPPVIMWEKASKKDLIFTGREGKVNKEVETEADDEMLTKRERKQKAKEENESKQQEWSQEAENGKKEPEAKENVDEERKQKRKGSQKGKKHGKALPQIVTNASVGQPTKQDEQNLTSPKRGKKKRDKENNGT